MKKTILAIVILLSLYGTTQAQLNMPQPSPGASFSQKFGLNEIKVEYSRPGVKGRKIFGALLPYGAIWRAGANDPTRFTTNDSITVAGKGLPKGTYIVLVKPYANEWELIFNKNPEVSYTNYKPEDDVVRVKVKTENTLQPVETFTITTSNITMNSCELDLMWENTMIRVPLVNEIDSKITAQIQQKLNGPTASEYITMARYYYDTNKDPKAALDFVSKGIAKAGEGFSNLWLQSMILAKMGNKKDAIQAAKKSRELAKTANNMDYVRMNEANIAEWSK